MRIPNTNFVLGGNRVFVVAEIGKGFIQSEDGRSVEEYLKNAKELVRLAKEAGADAVKFQTHNLEDEQLKLRIIAPHFKAADRYSWVKRNDEATPLWFWQELKKYCDELGIIFFSTPMSRGAAQKLDKTGINLWKVASCDLLDFPLLDYMAKSNKPMIISTGMSPLEEIDAAVDFLKKGEANFAILHCVSKYPCPPKESRLGTMEFLKNRYGAIIGFSDHSVEDFFPPFLAVAMGAKIIEKHFSLRRDLWGSDHKVALTPDELQKLCAGIRDLENNQEKCAALLAAHHEYIGGENEKIMLDDEAMMRPVFRKSLMAGRDIAAGEVITSRMVYAMRPQIYAGGLSSEKYEYVLGRKFKKSLKKYEPLTEDILD